METSFLLQRELKNELEHQTVISPYFYVHFHSHIEIYVVHSGEMEVLINNQRKILKDGELCVTFSYDSHGYRSLSKTVAEYIIIPRDYCKEILPAIEHSQIPSPFINDKKTYDLISHAMSQLNSDQGKVSERGWVYLILGAILDHFKNTENTLPVEKATVSHFAPEMLIYIGEHFREELTLPRLAKQFGYNPGYLSRSFKENFGISFCQYITMLRLREAVLLLQNGELSVTKCAFESGFGSIRSFYRAFHEKFGITPKEYLQKNNTK